MEDDDAKLLKKMATSTGTVVADATDGGSMSDAPKRRVKKKPATTNKSWVYPGRKMLPANHYKYHCLAIQKVKDAMLQEDKKEKYSHSGKNKRSRDNSSSDDEPEYKKKKEKKEKKEKKSKAKSSSKSSASSSAPKPRKGKKTLESEGFTEDMILQPTGKQSTKDYINQRLDDLRGMTIHKALKKYTYHDPERQKMRNYTFADLRYDVDTGKLQDPRK